MTAAQTIAKEFLDQWDRAHRANDVNYEHLVEVFAQFTGQVSIGEVEEVGRELAKGRKARGWPDPNPNTLEPSIEGAIVALWIGGLRNASPRVVRFR